MTHNGGDAPNSQLIEQCIRCQPAGLLCFTSMLSTRSSDISVCACVRGLDQRVALPRDSYLQAYFGDVTSALRVGPPLFLVVKDLNLSTAAPDVDRVCSVAGCDDGSLVNQVCSQLIQAKRHLHDLAAAIHAATVSVVTHVQALDTLHSHKAAVSGIKMTVSMRRCSS